MALSRRRGAGESSRTTIRLHPEDEQFYRKLANRTGVALSDFLRDLLHQGVIAQSVNESVELLSDAAKKFVSSMQSVNGASPHSATPAASARLASPALPAEVLESIFLCEALLSQIVNRSDMAAEQRARDIAKRRVADYQGKIK